MLFIGNHPSFPSQSSPPIYRNLFLRIQDSELPDSLVDNVRVHLVHLALTRGNLPTHTILQRKESYMQQKEKYRLHSSL